MTAYDATAAFDRVLHSITVITYRRLGIPMEACKFIQTLLHNMEFHIITGYGIALNSFLNNADEMMPGQGMLHVTRQHFCSSHI
jgi:hypothetical protein